MDIHGYPRIKDNPPKNKCQNALAETPAAWSAFKCVRTHREIYCPDSTTRRNLIDIINRLITIEMDRLINAINGIIYLINGRRPAPGPVAAAVGAGGCAGVPRAQSGPTAIC